MKAPTASCRKLSFSFVCAPHLLKYAFAIYPAVTPGSLMLIYISVVALPMASFIISEAISNNTALPSKST